MSAEGSEHPGHSPTGGRPVPALGRLEAEPSVRLPRNPGWFSATAPLWPLGVARILYGILWWQQSKWKVPADDFGRNSGGGLWYWVQQEIQYPTVPAYQAFLTTVVIPQWTLFGYLTLITETFIGVTLILGVFTRLGALVALGMAANITIGILSVPHEWGWTYTMLLMLAGLFMLTGSGRSLGVDAFLGPRLDGAARGGHRVARLLSWFT
jgi:thiosulfate dehydrogenase [quinone] large subunit